MLRQLGNEITRRLCSLWFPAGVLMCFLVYGMSNSVEMWINIVKYSSSTWVHRHNIAFTEFNSWKTLLPLAASLAGGVGIAENWEKHITFLHANRCSFSRYSVVNFLSSGICGGVVLMLGLWGFLGFMALHIPAFNDSTYREVFIEPLLVNGRWILYFIYYGSLQFLLGFLSTGVSSLVSVISKERGVIFLSPMILFAMIEITTNLTIVGLSGGQSTITFSVSQTPMHVWSITAIIFLALIMLVYYGYHNLLRKRVYLWN